MISKLSLLLLLISCSLMSQAQLNQLNQTQSLVGTHTLYEFTEGGLPVFNHQLKVNQFRNKTLQNESILLLEPYSSTVGEQSIVSQSKGWLMDEEVLIPVTRQEVFTHSGLSLTLFRNEQQEIIHHVSHNIYLKDTTVQGSVFLPDPITSSGAVYGGGLSDLNNANSTELAAELFNVDVKVTWDIDSFRLENEHLKIVDQSSPSVIPQSKSDNDFTFTRNENGFEEINAMYHITQFAEYVKDTLSFNQLVDYQIHVDVYALSGSDNSEFISTTTPPRLNFGQGGVDDAEDADILIHEYGHAIAFSAAPNTLSGNERRALDEGIGDYFAAVYSKRLNNNDYKSIFNWDGHNEFWEGRSIANSRVYPIDLMNQKYHDGVLFASMLMKIRNTIPDTVADKIILQSMFSWFSNMTFPDAGTLLLEADTALYAGEYSSMIHWILCERGFTTTNCSNSSNEIKLLEFVINSSAWQQGELSFINSSNQVTPFQLVTVNGQLVKQGITENSTSITSLSPGIYFLQAAQYKTLKLIIN